MPKETPKPMSKLDMYRQAHGLSWEAFAENIGIARGQLFRIVNGQTTNITLDTVEKIRKATGLSYEDYIVRPAPTAKKKR